MAKSAFLASNDRTWDIHIQGQIYTSQIWVYQAILSKIQYHLILVPGYWREVPILFISTETHLSINDNVPCSSLLCLSFYNTDDLSIYSRLMFSPPSFTKLIPDYRNSEVSSMRARCHLPHTQLPSHYPEEWNIPFQGSERSLKRGVKQTLVWR